MADKQFQIESSTKVVDHHRNTDQVVLEITEDKIELILRDYKKSINASNSWQVPLGLFISVSATIFTANFKDIPFVPASELAAAYKILAIVFLFWLLISGIRIFRNRKDLKDVIREMKNEG